MTTERNHSKTTGDTHSLPQGYIGVNLPPDELLAIYMTLHDDTIRAVNHITRDTCNDLMWFDFTRATVVCGIVPMVNMLYDFYEDNGLLDIGAWSEGEPERAL